MSRVGAILAWSAVAAPATAVAAGPLQTLVSATALQCEFPSGRATRWEQGVPVNETDRFRDAILVADIDHDNGLARLRGSAGSTEVVIVASVLGMTFLEGTEAGNLNVITVYPYLTGDNETNGRPEFAAVMSRHMMIDGNPVPSQHVGTCRPPE